MFNQVNLVVFIMMFIIFIKLFSYITYNILETYKEVVMNYYNPYFYLPSISTAPRVGLLSRIFGRSGATLSTILSGTQRVLGVANQAIPLVKQVQPMMKNAKTMFKLMNEFKKSDSKETKQNNLKNVSNNKNNTINNKEKENSISDVNLNNTEYSGPTFFI